MPWNLLIPLLSDTPGLSVIIDSDKQDYNLYTTLGSPSQPSIVQVLITANADVRTMDLGNWATGTVINLTMTNNGRILGRADRGGAGGETIPYGNNENEGQDGNNGLAGSAALTIPTNITVNLDMDDGFIYGGGGGGGGGGGTGGTDGNPNHGGGGGGGGGQGWDSNAGGIGGTDPVRPGDAGTTGNQSTPGIGGNSGRLNFVPLQVPPNGIGGDGGSWGLAGVYGDDCFQFNPILGGFNNNPGGSAGAAGASIQGVTATINFVGAKSEGTLTADPAQLRGPRNTL